MWISAVLLLVAWMAGGAEVRAQAGAEPAAGLTRVSGVAAGSGIEYVLISTEGKVASGGPARLIAQCSKTPGGKFELMADEPGGQGREAMMFQPPWTPAKGELFAPSLAKVQVRMEFFGYVKVKPVTRQWEYPLGSAGLIRYATPGMRSGNMEDVTFYLKYLASLPTLRLTVPGKGTEEFETVKWQTAVKAEPLCKGAGL